MPKLTAEWLREVLAYDPLTGAFTWLVNRRGRFARKGMRAGTLTCRGYRQICVDCRLYDAGPLAVLWMTGQWPDRLVDHRNLNKGDDRWKNLREANHSQNGANARGRGPLPKGVTRDRSKFVAHIRVNYRTLYLGTFNTAKAAHARYCKAAVEHFGEFARTQ
jgi:hypothetical protein